jgi:hypothetical protein
MIELSTIKKDCFGEYEIKFVIFDNRITNQPSRIKLFINSIPIFDNRDFIGKDTQAFITYDEIGYIANIDFKKASIQFITTRKDSELFAHYEDWTKPQLLQFLQSLPHQKIGEDPVIPTPEELKQISDQLTKLHEIVTVKKTGLMKYF